MRKLEVLERWSLMAHSPWCYYRRRSLCYAYGLPALAAMVLAAIWIMYLITTYKIF